MRRSRGGIFASCAQKIAANLRRPFPTRRIDPLQAALLLCLLAGTCGILLWRIPAKEQRTSRSVGQEHGPLEDTMTVRSRDARRGASSDFAVDPWEDLDEVSYRGVAPSLLRWLPFIHQGEDQLQVIALLK
jgi:hypothetical protein